MHKIRCSAVSSSKAAHSASFLVAKSLLLLLCSALLFLTPGGNVLKSQDRYRTCMRSFNGFNGNEVRRASERDEDGKSLNREERK